MTDPQASSAAKLDHEYGKPERCPHCGNLTAVEPSATLRFRCQVCGGPRVVVDDDAVQLSGREQRALKRAHRQRLRVVSWGAGAAVAGSFGALAALLAVVVLLVASPGVFGTLSLLLMAAAPLVVAALAWRKARHFRDERNAALDEAWTRAGIELLQQRGEELTGHEIVESMHLDEPHDETLLALLRAHEAVRTRVTDDGELSYLAAGAAMRLRVDGDDALAEAEAEAANVREPDAVRRERR